MCSLLDKVDARKIPIPIDYRGFSIEDVFVSGYGLDLDEKYRELPFIGVWEGTLDEEATDGEAPS